MPFQRGNSVTHIWNTCLFQIGQTCPSRELTPKTWLREMHPYICTVIFAWAPMYGARTRHVLSMRTHVFVEYVCFHGRCIECSRISIYNMQEMLISVLSSRFKEFFRPILKKGKQIATNLRCRVYGKPPRQLPISTEIATKLKVCYLHS